MTVMASPSESSTVLLNHVRELLLTHYSRGVLKKAERLLDDPDGIVPDEMSSFMWWAKASGENSDRERYRVQLIVDAEQTVWITCTCKNGATVGAHPTCYHTAACLALALSSSKWTASDLVR